VPERRRIAVTGIGPVTPIGTGVEEFWSAMIAGRSGAGAITRFDATDFKSRVAAEIHDFEQRPRWPWPTPA
jgi:3-oxoacyl-[acyl-carrier-protein] synthase II